MISVSRDRWKVEHLLLRTNVTIIILVIEKLVFLIIAPFSLWTLNKANKDECTNDSKSEQIWVSYTQHQRRHSWFQEKVSSIVWRVETRLDCHEYFQELLSCWEQTRCRRMKYGQNKQTVFLVRLWRSIHFPDQPYLFFFLSASLPFLVQSKRTFSRFNSLTIDIIF